MFRNLDCSKAVIQGELFQKCTHLLYCSVLFLGGNVNTRLMSKPDMGTIFHMKSQWTILCIMWKSKLSKFNAFNLHGYYSCLQTPPRENWFQHVRRVYATAINFPCVTFLDCSTYSTNMFRNLNLFRMFFSKMF